MNDNNADEETEDTNEKSVVKEILRVKKDDPSVNHEQFAKHSPE